MHAVGSAFLWIGFLQLFLNLREVTRLRVSWLRYCMTRLDVSAIDFEAIGMSPSDAERAASSKDRATTRAVCAEAIVNRCGQIVSSGERRREGHDDRAKDTTT